MDEMKKLLVLKEEVKRQRWELDRLEGMIERMSRDFNYSSAVMKDGLDNIIELAQKKDDEVLEALARNTLIRAGFLEYR